MQRRAKHLPAQQQEQDEKQKAIARDGVCASYDSEMHEHSEH
jgi:hypothetical protein